MIIPTLDTILSLHKAVQKIYPDITPGILNEGVIESITIRPTLKIFGHNPYDTVFKCAAFMVERIIRMHPFADGNKRTAILTAHHIIANNNYYLVTPSDTTDFLKRVASNTTQSQDDIDDLINEIAVWLEKHSVPTHI